MENKPEMSVAELADKFLKDALETQPFSESLIDLTWKKAVDYITAKEPNQ